MTSEERFDMEAIHRMEDDGYSNYQYEFFDAPAPKKAADERIAIPAKLPFSKRVTDVIARVASILF